MSIWRKLQFSWNLYRLAVLCMRSRFRRILLFLHNRTDNFHFSKSFSRRADSLCIHFILVKLYVFNFVTFSSAGDLNCRVNTQTWYELIRLCGYLCVAKHMHVLCIVHLRMHCIVCSCSTPFNEVIILHPCVCVCALTVEVHICVDLSDCLLSADLMSHPHSRTIVCNHLCSCTK